MSQLKYCQGPKCHIYDNKSKQFVSKSGVNCITFWDTLRKRYTTATNYVLNILGENA